MEIMSSKPRCAGEWKMFLLSGNTRSNVVNAGRRHEEEKAARGSKRHREVRGEW